MTAPTKWDFEVLDPEFDFEGTTTARVSGYPEAKQSGSLIGGRDLVTAETTIQFDLEYPLGGPAGVTASHPKGFTRLRLFEAIYRAYLVVYDASQPEQTKRYQNEYSMESGGPYGIWGHCIDALFLDGVEQLSPTTFALSIGS